MSDVSFHFIDCKTGKLREGSFGRGELAYDTYPEREDFLFQVDPDGILFNSLEGGTIQNSMTGEGIRFTRNNILGMDIACFTCPNAIVSAHYDEKTKKTYIAGLSSLSKPMNREEFTKYCQSENKRKNDLKNGKRPENDPIKVIKNEDTRYYPTKANDLQHIKSLIITEYTKE
jgi:hypothetical protein